MIDEALNLAARVHKRQVRKGTDIPYIVHPCAVAVMLARVGADDEVIAAGILHDTVEDTWVTLEEIKQQFGDRVAAIVEGCSEPHKEAAWEVRKRHTLAYLPTTSYEIRLVACADKLHNIGSMLEDYRLIGESLWSHFNRGRAEQEWYYRGLVVALCTPRPDESSLPFCETFSQAVSELFGLDES